MRTYPHCDSNVLHSPGKCKYCDEFAGDLQRARQVLRINFTDTDFEGWAPCPATQSRPVETINKWGGNVPVAEGEETESDWFGYQVPKKPFDFDGDPEIPCDLPPKGWWCSLGKGHSGACPTHPTGWTKFKRFIQRKRW